MAAEFDSGMFVNTPAWHLGGNVLDKHPESWQEAREHAGLMWEPLEYPIYSYSGVNAEGRAVGQPGDGVTGDYFPDPDRKRIARSDTGDTLGVVKASYELITHAEMGEVVDALLEQPTVKYETAGALKGGALVWALAMLDEPVTLKGDNSVTLPYLAVTTAHDGSGALTATTTAVRIVCANTWKAAEVEGERNGTTYSFRHTKNWRDRKDEAQQVIRGARESFAKYVEIAQDLLEIRVTPTQREIFLNTFVPEPPAGLASDRVLRNVQQARDAIRKILNSETTQPVAHTAYGLVQAAGEYADHVRNARSWETRLNRSLLSVENAKVRAVKIARVAANA